MSMAKEVTIENFKTEVEESEIPVLVDFWAEWCGPCQQLAPRIDELAQEYEGKAKFAKVDVDNNQELAGQFGIRSIPTLLIFDGGKRVDQLVGSVPSEKIREHLDEYV
ncbi:MAG: thioredoxin [bacterium]